MQSGGVHLGSLCSEKVSVQRKGSLDAGRGHKKRENHYSSPCSWMGAVGREEGKLKRRWLVPSCQSLRGLVERSRSS